MFSSLRTSRRFGRFLVPLIACLALPLLAMCGRDNPTQPRSTVAVRVVVTPETTDLASAGQSARLNAQALDASGQEVPEAPVTWRSSDSSVARVSGDGLVTAVGDGSAVITATAGQKTGNARVTVSDPVRRALVELYRATGGENWKNGANWLSDEPISTWYGVSRNSAGHVADLNARASVSGLTRLDLSDNGLTGEIPPSLGNLTGLRYLNLADNALTGAIPPALGNLSALETLRLNGNRLSGELPSELGNLGRLRDLSLHGNGELTGQMPLSLARLANLETLSLSGTLLCAPDDSAIQHWLEGIDNKIGVANCGDDTDVDRNVLIALYNATDGANWTNGANWVTDQPLASWFGVGVNAEGRVDSLILADNALSGPLPASLGSLAGLVALDASGNRLSGRIPEELGNLGRLRDLSLHGNGELIGQMPLSLTRLANLETLSLSGTLLCAPDDSAIQNWLEGIDNKIGVVHCGDDTDVDRNVLIALYNATDGANWTNGANWVTDQPLASWFGVGVNAEGRVDSLNLEDNALSGPLPASLGSLAGLVTLDASGNRLSGRIPEELGNLSALETLDLSNNMLTGTIPHTLFNLPNLVTLELAGNQFTDIPVPSARDALVALYHATDGPNWIRNDNWLSDVPLGDWYGVTTDAAGRVTSLQLIVTEDDDITAGNGLSGPIPSELGSLTDLTNLNLFGNQLSGPIPTELGNLANLTNLELDGNRLSGSIPTVLGSLSNLKYLNLSSNQLSGSIPTELGSLTNLRYLWLYHNQLSGSIPTELGSFTNLQWLDIGGNQLSGSVPTELGSLTNLRWLDFSENSALDGPLPGSFTGLDSLEYLALDDTGLCAPADAAFQAWLEGIQGETSGVVNCGPPPPISAELVGRWNYTGNNFLQRFKQNARAYLIAQNADQDEIDEIDSLTVTIEFFDFRSDGMVYIREFGETTNMPYTVTGGNQFEIEFEEVSITYTYSITGNRLTLSIAVSDVLALLDTASFDESEREYLTAAYSGIEQLIYYFDRDTGS